MHETRICLVFVADPVSWFFLTEIYFIQLKIKEVLIINKAECRSSEYVALQICYLVLWHDWEKIKKDKRHVICVLQTFSINFKYNVYRLVLFVGGYTMAEVAAFRWLQAATGFFLSN